MGPSASYVWYDLNNDGVQDPGEAGIPGVTVELWSYKSGRRQ